MTAPLHQEEARAVLEAKLALEAEVAPRIHAVMRQYLGLWAEGRGHVGWIPKSDAIATLVQVLERHFARVVLVMTGRRPTPGATIAEAALTGAHAESLRQRARTQARLIIDGLDKRLATVLAEVRTGRKMADTDGIETKTDGGVIDKPPPIPGPDSTPTTGYTGDLQRAIDHVRGELTAKSRAAANMGTNGVANEGRRIIVTEPGDADGQVMQRWHNQQDERVRHPPRSAFDHVSAHGQTVPVTSHYVVSGEKLRFPGDVGMGASIGNTINCFPAGTKVSGAVVAATRHWFSGELVEITTSTGKKLAGTPNHPVLTRHGWVGLGALNEGDDCVCRAGLDDDAPGLLGNGHQVDDVQPGIEQVFDALARRSMMMRVSGVAVDFHGDRTAEQVDVVRADSALHVGNDATLGEHLGKLGLSGAFLDLGQRLPDRLESLLAGAGDLAAPRDVGVSSDCLALVLGGFGEAEQICLAAGARGDAGIIEASRDRDAGDAERFGDGQHGLALIEPRHDVGNERCAPRSARRGPREAIGARHSEPVDGFVNRGEAASDLVGDLLHRETALVQFERVVRINRRVFAGHVYNLQTTSGTYVGNGIIVHNCRCYSAFLLKKPDGTEAPLYTMPWAPAKRIRKPGDRVGRETPATATSRITLNGKTKAKVVLKDGTLATLEQVRPDTLVVRVGGKTVGRAVIGKDGALGQIAMAPGQEARDILGLMQRSVEGTAKWMRLNNRTPPWAR